MSTEPVTVSSAVRASNELTARWCGAVRADTSVAMSGAGLWPLLALLASAAEHDAKDELAAAIGRPADTAQSEAVELLSVVAEADAASAALALWLRRGLTVADPAWADGLPAGALRTLAGQAQVDAWAAEHTRGLIQRLPLHVSDADMLVLATALAVKTRWKQLFEPTSHETAGPWAGHRAWISRVTDDLGSVALLAGAEAVTRVVVAGRDDVDVHLLVGRPEAEPGSVLQCGIRALAGEVPIVPAAHLADGATGNGFAVRTVEGARNTVRLTLPPWTIRSSHDLRTTPELFGLRAATDARAGQFPRLADDLYVSGAAQDVLAQFSWEGFEAAAVTAVSMVRAALMRPKGRARRVEVTLDRPFGFLAVHRPTGLALVAGWVAEP